ncbi:hypothetical protein ACQ4PT_013047 [Festuca glaucescens]
MRVFVKRLDRSIITISGVESSDTVESFRVRVQEQDGIGAKQRQGGVGIRPARQRAPLRRDTDGGWPHARGLRHAERNNHDASRPLDCQFTGQRAVELDMDITDTVGRIKERVEEAEGVPVECQSLLLGAEELDDGRTLSHYIFETGTFVKIQCRRQEGGAAANTTTKGKGQEPVIGNETVKRRAYGDVTGLARKNNKGIPAPQWRLVVHLLGPELAAICPSSLVTMVGNDITIAVLEAINDRTIPQGWNETVIVLIPKVERS